MNDCCIGVTALLEYFEWTQSNTRAKGVAFLYLFLNHASGWGQLLMLISYLGSVIEGRVPALDH